MISTLVGSCSSGQNTKLTQISRGITTFLDMGIAITAIALAVIYAAQFSTAAQYALFGGAGLSMYVLMNKRIQNTPDSDPKLNKVNSAKKEI